MKTDHWSGLLIKLPENTLKRLTGLAEADPDIHDGIVNGSLAIGYVIGVSGDKAAWVYSHKAYACSVTGEYVVNTGTVAEMLECISDRGAYLTLPVRQFISEKMLDDCISDDPMGQVEWDEMEHLVAAATAAVNEPRKPFSFD